MSTDDRWRDLTLGNLDATEAAALQAADPDRYRLRRPFTPREKAKLFARVERSLLVQKAIRWARDWWGRAARWL